MSGDMAHISPLESTYFNVSCLEQGSLGTEREPLPTSQRAQSKGPRAGKALHRGSWAVLRFPQAHGSGLEVLNEPLTLSWGFCYVFREYFPLFVFLINLETSAGSSSAPALPR